MKAFFASLSKKSFLALTIILLPILIAFLIGYRTAREELRSLIFNDLITMAEAYEGQVYQFLEMSKRRAQDFASDGFVRDELQKIAAGDKDASFVLSEHLTNNKKPLDKSIHDIHMVIRDRIVASTDRSAIGKEMPVETSLLAAKFKPVAVESMFLNLPSLLVFAPVTNRVTGEQIGSLAYSMNIYELNKVINGEFVKELGAGAASWKRVKAQTQDAYLVNKDKLMITSSRFIKDAIFKQKVNTLPVSSCLESGRESTGFYRNYRSMKVAGVSMCLPSIDWVLIVEIDRDEIWQPVTVIKRYALMAGISVIGLIGVLFVVFSRNVVRPLRNMSDAARDIAAGNYDITLPVKGSDEIGSLSESFNIMASEIEARTMSLKKSEASLANAQRIARLGNWDWDIENNELNWSDEIYRIFGVEPREFEATYEAFLGYVHPDDLDYVKKAVDAALSGEKAYSIDHRIVLRDGSEKILHEYAEVLFDARGLPVKMSGTVQDVTEHKRAESELKKLSMAIDHSINIVFVTSFDGTIEYVNPMFEKVTGWSKEEAIGQNPRILASGETAPSEYEELWGAITSGKTWRGSFKNKKKNGQPYWGNAVITPIKDERGDITHFLAVQEDVTEKRLSEERIQYLACYDDMTGLINRARFMELLSEWIYHAKPHNKGVLLLLDIDEFKFVNDTYGHGVGDELLRRTTGLLHGIVKGADSAYFKTTEGILLGRMGGDEFSVFLPELDGRGGMMLAEEIRNRFGDFRLIEGLVHATASIGVAVYPEHGRTTKDLFTRVDAAVYRAKAMGRNRCHLYSPEDKVLENIHSRFREKEKIQKALKEDRFEPCFQPILDLKDNKVHHYEVLARMRDEEGEVLLPRVFIDTAEMFGLIGAIDRVITEKAMRLQAKLRREGRYVSFGMNISGKNLGDAELLSFLQEKIIETGADPNYLMFEITETAAVHDLERAIKFINSLKSMGCHFLLDDFGVGFTSFVYLKELKVDYVKIDGSFIRKLHENRNDQLFVKAITDVAIGMGIKTVAEFVEKEETIRFLKEFGIDYAQGYHIGMPAPELLS